MKVYNKRPDPIKYLIWTLPGVLFVALAWQDLAPTGRFVVDVEAGERSPFVDPLIPESRASAAHLNSEADPVQTVTSDPTYLFLHPHRKFDALTAEVWFQNHGAPVIELGILSDPRTNTFTLRPIYHRVLEELTWPKLTDGTRTLWQKTPTAVSVQDFFTQGHDFSHVAAYHVDWQREIRLEDYPRGTALRDLGTVLRGSHEFRLYAKNERVTVRVNAADLNLRAGSDALLLELVDQNGTILDRAELPDDGNATDNNLLSPVRLLQFTSPRLAEGMYTLRLIATPDVSLRLLETSARKWMAVNRLDTTDEMESPKPWSGWIRPWNMSAATEQAEAAEQRIQVGDTSTSLRRPYERVELKPMNRNVAIHTDKGGVIFEGSGRVAFWPDGDFVDGPVPLTPQMDLEAFEITSVIAKYVPPTSDGMRPEGFYQHGRAEFVGTQIALDAPRTTKLVLSLPGISSAPGASVDIARWRLAWTRPPLTLSDFARIPSLLIERAKDLW